MMLCSAGWDILQTKIQIGHAACRNLVVWDSAYGAQGSDPLGHANVVLSRPLYSGCTRASKSGKPLDLALTFRVHRLQKIWCCYFYLSLTIWLWSLIVIAFFTYQAGDLWRPPLPKRVDETLPALVITLIDVICPFFSMAAHPHGLSLSWAEKAESTVFWSPG